MHEFIKRLLMEFINFEIEAKGFVWYNNPRWRVGGAVTRRSAKPFRRVRLSYVPPLKFNMCPDGGCVKRKYV